MTDLLAGTVAPPPWPWRIGRILVGLRVPEQHRAWVAVQLRVYDDLRYRALRCSVMFLLVLDVVVLLLGPQSSGPIVMFQLPGMTIGVGIAVWRVRRDPKLRDLPYRMAGVHRDGTVDPAPSAAWLPVINIAVVSLSVISIVALGLSSYGTRLRHRLSVLRANGQCQAVPTATQTQLVDLAVPGTVFVGFRQLHQSGETLVAARSRPPLTVLGRGITIDGAGTAVWRLQPDVFGPSAGPPQAVTLPAQAAAPSLGLGSGGTLAAAIRTAAACAEHATAPVVVSPVVHPSVAVGHVVIHGAIELQATAPPVVCGGAGASLRFDTPSGPLQITVFPPIAELSVAGSRYSARASVTGGRVAISGPVHVTAPNDNGIRPAAPTAPLVGDIEALVPCR